MVGFSILKERIAHRGVEMKWYSSVALAVSTLLAAFLITLLKTDAQEPSPFYWGFINVDINVQDDGDMIVMICPLKTIPVIIS
jgi:hypothetical protein